MKVFLGRKFIQSFVFSHLLIVCMHYERLLLHGDSFFHVMSPRCFELGMLHSFGMLCSGKRGTFSPVLLLDASTTLANKSVENLLHLVFLQAGVCW